MFLTQQMYRATVEAHIVFATLQFETMRAYRARLSTARTHIKKQPTSLQYFYYKYTI